MAKKKSLTSKILGGKFKWQESYPSLILGAIIVVILGLLVANFISRKGAQQIGNGAQAQNPEQTAERTYKVAVNDSLSKISEKLYGSQEYWPMLAQVNNIVNPNKIFVDAQLKIPAKADIDKMKADMTATTYQVQQGDTLFTIAQKVYGDGSQWQKLHRANGSRWLVNGNPLVTAGSTIVIPR